MNPLIVRALAGENRTLQIQQRGPCRIIPYFNARRRPRAASLSLFQVKASSAGHT